MNIALVLRCRSLTAACSARDSSRAPSWLQSTAGPITNSTLSDNGEEDVDTESASLALTSGLSPRLMSHLRAQFSRDLQSSVANSDYPRTHITNVFDGIGRSSILPRDSREHRLHLAETLSFDQGRNAWKFGGEYYYDTIFVDPWTFDPMRRGLKLTPLRAYAHQVPRYYIQNFGNAVSNPDTNEYATFLQDTVRVTHRLALSLGARYDLQIFTTKGLVSNPLWPQSGKVPFNDRNVSPRIGLAYSIGNARSSCAPDMASSTRASRRSIPRPSPRRTVLLPRISSSTT